MENKGKGIRKQISDNTTYSELSLEKIENVLSELLEKEEDYKFSFEMYSYCKTFGGIRKYTVSSGICGDPECKTCSEIDNAMREGLEKNMENKGEGIYNQISNSKTYTSMSTTTYKDFLKLLKEVEEVDEEYRKELINQRIQLHPSYLLHCTDIEFKSIWNSDTYEFITGAKMMDKIINRAKSLGVWKINIQL